jgi:hypothetical protein
MAVRPELTSENVIITLTGADAVWAIKRRLIIDRQRIVSAKVMDRKAAIKLLRLRLWGSYLPGVVCAGTFSVSKKAGVPPGSRAFMSLYRAKEVLVVTTSSGKPAIIGVETPQPEAFAAALSASAR